MASRQWMCLSSARAHPPSAAAILWQFVLRSHKRACVRASKRALLHLAEKALITKYIVQCVIKALCCSAGRKTRAKKVRHCLCGARGEAINIKRKSTSSHAKSHNEVNKTPLLKRRSLGPTALVYSTLNRLVINIGGEMHSQGRAGVAAVNSLRRQSMRAFGNAYIAQTMQRFMDTRRVTRALASPPDGAAFILIKFFPGL